MIKNNDETIKAVKCVAFWLGLGLLVMMCSH